MPSGLAIPLGEVYVHPLAGASFMQLVKTMHHVGGVERGSLARLALTGVLSLINEPGRWRSRLQYGASVNRTEFKESPIFIVGHWRSGTTYLHELLSQDPSVAPATVWHTMSPRSFLAIRCLRRLYARFLPDRRPMDSVEVTLDASYEEDAAMAALSPLSFFNCLYFPAQAERLFRQAVLFEDVDQPLVERWKRDYVWFLKAVTLDSGGRRLVLKNPPNTARIRTLLELFPDARFVHIYRNPYVVYPSTLKMRLSTIRRFGLQRTTAEAVERQVLSDYISLMQAYFDQRSLIPPDRLVELRFEDLEADPIASVRHIYQALDLSGYARAQPAMSEFVESQADYRKNQYVLDDKTRRRVEEHWGFTLDRWGYEPPGPALQQPGAADAGECSKVA